MTQTSPTQKSVDIESLAKDAAVALIIKVGGLVLIYLAQIFLARWMGKSEYGIYEYVIAWSVLLAVVAGLGLPRAALRLIPEYRVKEEWGLTRGLLRGSWLLTLVTGVLLALVVAGIVLLLNNYRSSFIYGIPLLLGSILVPLQALMQLQQETSRAMGDLTLAFAPYLIIWPVLVICGAFFLIKTQHSLSSLPAIEVAIGSLFLVVVFQWLLLQQKIHKDLEVAAPVYAYRQWLGISLILLVQRAFLMILDQTDIIMVGSLAGSESAGLYNAAAKTALWVRFVLEMLNWVVAPVFATLYAKGDMQGLQKVVSKITLWIFWPSIVISLFLLVFYSASFEYFWTWL
jgi:O-antigen/teichoic acid export membrane protein